MIVFIVLLVFAVYYRTFNFHLIVDDVRRHDSVKKGCLNYKFSAAKSISSMLKYPFVILRKRLYGCGTLGLNIKIDHIFQTSIHAFICVLIYLAFGSNQISFFAAILYALNPTNMQTSVWLNGRRYAMVIVLTLFMMMAGLKGLILYPLAMVFQVTGIFSPVLALGPAGIMLTPLILFLFRKELKAKYKTRLKIMFNDDQTTIHPKKLIVAVKLYGMYLSQMILPVRTMMNYKYFEEWGVTEEGNKDAYSFNNHFFFGVFALLTTGYALLNTSGVLFNYILFMFLATFQWCGIVSVTQIYTDRYITLPNVFMMFFISYFLSSYLPQYAVPTMIALSVYYYTNLERTFVMYKDLKNYWDFHIFHNPSSATNYLNKANWYLNIQDPLAAWEVIKQGLLYKPNHMTLNILAAVCMNKMGDKESCLNYLKLAQQNVFIGQQNVIDSFKHKIFGIDIDKEYKSIQAKTSKYDRKQREHIEKVYGMLSPA